MNEINLDIEKLRISSIYRYATCEYVYLAHGYEKSKLLIDICSQRGYSDEYVMAVSDLVGS